MSVIRTTAAVAALAGLALFTTPAQAQYSESSAWITPFAGAYFGGSFTPVSNTYGVRKLDVGTSFTYGARLGYKFNPSIGLVFEYAHADPTMTVQCNTPSAGPYCGKEIDLGSNIYEGTFNFYFGSTPQMQGYIAIGGGASNLNGSGQDSTGASVSGSSTQFSTVFGLGGTKMFNEKVGMTLDGRYRWVNVNGADSYYCYYYCYAYDTSWYGSGEITLGVKYQFK
ncbi:MAG: outer membrane beta-barrel protein [Gemmatimonadales bacterium]